MLWSFRAREEAAFVPWSVLAGIFFLLMGLEAAWIGVYRVRFDRFPPRGCGVDPRLAMSPVEMGLWLIAWTTMALGLVCLGVAVLRYAKGTFVSVPASAPLINQIIFGKALPSRSFA
jgi:hypothetical protein